MAEDKYAQSTVGALKNTLAGLPDHAVVILSSDAEGNDFQVLDGVDRSAHWNARLEEISVGKPKERSDLKNIRRAVVLFPQYGSIGGW